MTTAFGSSTAQSTTSTSITITKPTGLAVGDMMVAILGIADSAMNFASSGWTAKESNTTGAVKVRTLFKIADAGDVAASDFTFTTGGAGSRGTTGFIVRVTGSAFTSAVNLFSTLIYDSNSVTGHTFTPGINIPNGSLLLVGSFADAVVTQSAYAIANSSPTFTERHDTGIASGTTCHGAIASAIYADTDPTGDLSITYNSARPGTAFIIAIHENASADGNHPILTMASTIYTTGISVGTQVTHAILSFVSSIFSGHKGKIRQNNRWSSQKNTEKDWTNQKQ